MKRSIINMLWVSVLILFLFSCTEKKWGETYTRPAYVTSGGSFDVLSKNPDFKEFVGLLKKTGLDSVLLQKRVNTVLAPPNGSFAGIDTTSNLAGLKETIGMHIFPSSVFRESMEGKNSLSVSGKLLKFAVGAETVFVNGKQITSFDQVTANGVIHEIGGAIIPKPNLYDVVMSSSDLTAYQDFIDNSYAYWADPDNNIRIGYDSIGNPVYKEPINYIRSSDYLNYSGLQDEGNLRTGFFPTDQLVEDLIGGILPARDGNLDLIVPRLDDTHGDTIVGWRYFKGGEAYPGDTAVLLNDIYRYIIANGAYPELGDEMYNSSGTLISVTGDQVKSVEEVSNGYSYIMNDLSIPELLYRKEVFFLPSQKVPDPNDPEQSILNPNIIYGGLAKYSKTQGKPNVTVTGKYTIFDMRAVGSTIDFVFPFVPKGSYQVEYSYFPENNNGRLDVSYNSQVLIQDMNISGTYNSRRLAAVPTVIGTINVSNNDPVLIRFTCSDSNQKSFKKYWMTMDYLKLIPVDAP